MGIRYYAYAFDPELAQQAVDDPFSILSDDPLADAWGLEPHATVSTATFEQAVPKRDMLYLDKAWTALQDLTRPDLADESARAAFRMFEGRVRMHDRGWDPWVRVILPEDVPAIRDGLSRIGEPHVKAWVRSARFVRGEDEEFRYILDYLTRAKEFVDALANAGRGMVYEIG